MKDEILLGAIGVACITVLAVACFYFTGEDGTILASAAGAIGTVIGVVLGRTSIAAGGTGGP